MSEEEVQPKQSVATVAVIDDEAQARKTATLLLAEAGYQVVQAADGIGALEVVEQHPVEVILLDVMMPKLNGYEVCRRLRNLHGFRIGIILISGSRREPLDCGAGLDSGADDYITKPWDANELLARVRSTLRRVRAHNASETRRHPLTPRQLEILLMLAEGETVREIADRLFLSPATIRKHVERILATLGLRSRTEAVAWAFREGLTPPTRTTVPVRLEGVR